MTSLSEDDENPFDEDDLGPRVPWRCKYCNSPDVFPDYGLVVDAGDEMPQEPWYCPSCQKYQDYPLRGDGE